MTVEARGKDHNPLPCLRTARLSKNILMVLFEGEIQTICFGLPKEALHLDLTNRPPDWLSSHLTSADLAKSLLNEQHLVEFTAGVH